MIYILSNALLGIGYIPAKRNVRRVISCGDGQCFTKALAIPNRYKGSHIPLGRDLSYSYHIISYSDLRSCLHKDISDQSSPMNAAI